MVTDCIVIHLKFHGNSVRLLRAGNLEIHTVNKKHVIPVLASSKKKTNKRRIGHDRSPVVPTEEVV